MSISGTNEATQSVPFGTPVATGDSNAAGSAATAARSDHVHKGVVANEAWTAYTPTNTNVTVGDGTQTAKYVRIGRTIHWNYILVFGSTTAFSGTVAIGLPVQSGLGTETNHGVVWMQDSSTGANNQNGSCFLVSGGTTVRPVYDGGGTGINATTPFTWATGDRLTISGTYEAAS